MILAHATQKECNENYGCKNWYYETSLTGNIQADPKQSHMELYGILRWLIVNATSRSKSCVTTASVLAGAGICYWCQHYSRNKKQHPSTKLWCMGNLNWQAKKIAEKENDLIPGWYQDGTKPTSKLSHEFSTAKQQLLELPVIN